jgi:hypothetical protein
VTVAAATTLTACGSDSGAGAPSSSGGSMSLSIAEPASGASLAAPFNLKVNTNVDLGTTDTGKHHLHVYLDNNSNDYLKVYSPSGGITTLPKLTPGQHVLHVSLRNADHSPAGAEAQVPITITGTSGGTAPSSSPTDNGGGGAYGY